MNDRNAAQNDPIRKYLPAMLLLFVGSGCAALIYEVVWFQLLQLVIGSSSVSLGVLLGTFMGGMCLGSYLLPRYVGGNHHPLKIYAYLELGIGFMGLILLFGMPLVNGLYVWIGGGHIAVRAIVAAICLLPPTFMMGATLPAVSRWVKTTPSGVAWLGYFYGGNIGGAVIGSLLAGFYLLRVFDMAIASYVAVALNVTVALLGLLLSRITPGAAPEAETGDVRRAPGARTVYIAIAMSGFTALAAQVLWTRLLSLTFGATAYTFSLILGGFLFGLGIGSSIGAGIARTTDNPRMALGWAQMMLCGALAWAGYMLMASMPYWPINPQNVDPWFTFQIDLVRCLWVVLPGAILWGMSFPLALAAVAAPGQDPGRLVGGVYAANTVGAILGSVASGLLLVTWLGTHTSMQVLIVFSAVSALMLLAPVAAGETGRGQLNWGPTVLLVVATAGAGLLARTVPDLPRLLIAYGRYSATWVGLSNIIYAEEGLNASVAVSEMSNGVRNYHNAGKVQASSEPQDMRLQRMLGHLTHLIPSTPSNALVIGCGAGVTAGAVSIGPRVKTMTIAEIEPLVPRSVARYFWMHNYSVVGDERGAPPNKKVTIHIDDARHFLLTTNQKFDAITSDPLDPWVKGAATLYTEEFFELVKKKLNPGGVVTLFVQLYESNEAAVKSEIGTFFKAFPNSVVWGNTNNGQGYDLVLMGQLEPIKIDLDAMEAKYQSQEFAQVAQSLQETGFGSITDLFATYAGQPSDLAPWLADVQINRDRNLRLQYLAGLGLNLYQSGPIYAEMISHATKFPEGLFTGSPEKIEELKRAFERVRNFR
ncbi:MAG TPA: fused MFS/spermidine synthase [Vicinamibacterales bacterium]|nr:fused MFS/spermidine synthase [Vicinamibacterales bacterium]